MSRGSDIRPPATPLPRCGNGPGAICLPLIMQGRDAIVVQDMQGCITWMNPAAEAMFGWPLSKVRGRRGLTLVQARDTLPDAAVAAFRYDPESSIFSRYILARHRRRDGTLFWNQQGFTLVAPSAHCAGCGPPGTPPPGGQSCFVAISCRDVTEQIETERKLRATKAELLHAAHHDDLTGLANRKRLTAFLASDIARHALAGHELGVLQLDLDKFKEINDTLGHHAGDATLQHVARALRAASMPHDLACRTGGDEFLLVCLRVGTPDALRQRAQRILDAIADPLRWRDQVIRIGCSIGTSLAAPGPAEGTEQGMAQGMVQGETLIMQADQALYAAKQRGRGRIVCYAPAIGQRQTSRNQMARDIRTALAEAQFEIHLQPQLHLQRRRITGCEALLRWNHPRFGQVTAGDFLEVARRAGILADLDYASLNLALDALQQLYAAGFTDLALAVNVSAEVLSDAEYPALLQWALQSRGLPAKALCIEITETTILDRQDCAITQAVDRVKRLGAKVALDDFGTGYAGLAHMSAIDVDAIKLDRSMTARLVADRRAREIVGALIGLCRQLGTHVVAEGVETPQQAQILRAAKCPLIQGYGVARPMPVAAMIRWLHMHATDPDMLLHLPPDPPARAAER